MRKINRSWGLGSLAKRLPEPLAASLTLAAQADTTEVGYHKEYTGGWKERGRESASPLHAVTTSR